MAVVFSFVLTIFWLYKVFRFNSNFSSADKMIYWSTMNPMTCSTCRLFVWLLLQSVANATQVSVHRVT